MSNRLDMKKIQIIEKTKQNTMVRRSRTHTWAMTSNGFSGHWCLLLLICASLQSHSFRFDDQV